MTDWTFTPDDHTLTAPSGRQGTHAYNWLLSVLADGVPRKTSPDISLRHIPGGATTYIDIGGANLLTIDLSVLFTTGSWAIAYEALEGQPGTLVGAVTDIGGSAGSVPVIFNSIQRMSRGVNTAGPVVLSIDFIITGAAS